MAAETYLPIRPESPEGNDCRGAGWLIKRTLHALLCIAIPLAFWALVIRWSTENINEKINQQIPQHDMKMEVKKFEIKEFDMEGFRKSLGMSAE